MVTRTTAVLLTKQKPCLENYHINNSVVHQNEFCFKNLHLFNVSLGLNSCFDDLGGCFDDLDGCFDDLGGCFDDLGGLFDDLFNVSSCAAPGGQIWRRLGDTDDT